MNDDEFHGINLHEKIHSIHHFKPQKKLVPSHQKSAYKKDFYSSQSMITFAFLFYKSNGSHENGKFILQKRFGIRKKIT
jgi:hypothetical protein